MRLEKHSERSQETVQRYDVFQAAVLQGQTAIIVGNDGLVLEMDVTDPSAVDRIILVDENSKILPSFISSTICPDGTVYLLAFDGGLWAKPRNGQWSSGRVQTQEAVQDLTCVDTGDLIVSASFATLLRSADKGLNWTETSQDEDLIYTQLAFPTGSTGYAFGEFGVVSKTSDAGVSWTQIAGPGPEYYPLAAYFKSPMNGWTAGLGGAIYYTDDGGANWIRESNNSKAPIYNIAEINGRTVAIGNYGTFLARNDDGIWHPLADGAPQTSGFLRAIAVPPKGANGDVFLGGQGYAARLETENIKFDEAG